MWVSGPVAGSRGAWSRTSRSAWLPPTRRPDHATIARFGANHETAIAGLFGQVLAVCAGAGLLRPGLVAIDGTKLTANASRDANRTAEQIAERILAEAAATDAATDAAEDATDDGPGAPGELGERGGRRARLRALLDELQAELTGLEARR